MDHHLIKNVKSPVNKFDAVDKAYADRIKYKTAISKIHNTDTTYHTFFTYPSAKSFASGKIIICEMWFQWLADEWIATSRPMFATAWPGYHKFLRDPSLITFFNSSPTGDWTCNFRFDYTELP